MRDSSGRKVSASYAFKSCGAGCAGCAGASGCGDSASSCTTSVSAGVGDAASWTVFSMIVKSSPPWDGLSGAPSGKGSASGASVILPRGKTKFTPPPSMPPIAAERATFWPKNRLGSVVSFAITFCPNCWVPSCTDSSSAPSAASRIL